MSKFVAKVKPALVHGLYVVGLVVVSGVISYLSAHGVDIFSAKDEIYVAGVALPILAFVLKFLQTKVETTPAVTPPPVTPTA